MYCVRVGVPGPAAFVNCAASANRLVALGSEALKTSDGMNEE
jgi:hypothetical protein